MITLIRYDLGHQQSSRFQYMFRYFIWVLFHSTVTILFGLKKITI